MRILAICPKTLDFVVFTHQFEHNMYVQFILAVLFSIDGVTRFFRENHTLSSEMPSQAALQMTDLRGSILTCGSSALCVLTLQPLVVEKDRGKCFCPPIKHE